MDALERNGGSGMTEGKRCAFCGWVIDETEPESIIDTCMCAEEYDSGFEAFCSEENEL